MIAPGLFRCNQLFSSTAPRRFADRPLERFARFGDQSVAVADHSFGLLRVVREGVFAPREGEGIIADLHVETIRSAIRMRNRKTGGPGLADYVARNSSKSRLNVTRIASTGRDRMGR